VAGVIVHARFADDELLAVRDGVVLPCIVPLVREIVLEFARGDILVRRVPVHVERAQHVFELIDGFEEPVVGVGVVGARNGQLFVEAALRKSGRQVAEAPRPSLEIAYLVVRFVDQDEVPDARVAFGVHEMVHIRGDDFRIAGIIGLFDAGRTHPLAFTAPVGEEDSASQGLANVQLAIEELHLAGVPVVLPFAEVTPFRQHHHACNGKAHPLDALAHNGELRIGHAVEVVCARIPFRAIADEPFNSDSLGRHSDRKRLGLRCAERQCRCEGGPDEDAVHSAFPSCITVRYGFRPR